MRRRSTRAIQTLRSGNPVSGLPRFFLVHDLVPAKTLAEARRIIGQGEIDFRRTAIVDDSLIPSCGRRVRWRRSSQPRRLRAGRIVAEDPKRGHVVIGLV
jgi:hypothetical protein